MLEINIPAMELFNESDYAFINIPKQHLQLEHSLVSLSKWEAKWHKPFISKEPLTREETLDYIRCMTVNIKNIDERIYEYMPDDIIEQVNKYIEDPMTATWFGNKDKKPQTNKRVITSELLYYWMISLQIPVEFEKWHLNRLLTLVEVCNEENKLASGSKKKPSTNSLIRDYAAINKANRARFNSKG